MSCPVVVEVLCARHRWRRPWWMLGGMRTLLYSLLTSHGCTVTHVVWYCVVCRAVALIIHTWG